MNHIGSTIYETLAAFRSHLGGNAAGSAKLDRLNAITRIIISLMLLAAGIYFASSPDPTQAKGGMTIIGLIAGYWLR